MRNLFFGPSIFLAASSSCVSATPDQSVSSVDLVQEESASLAADVRQWAAKQEFNGVIAVDSLETRTVSQAFGIASQNEDRALTVNSVFQKGSVGKLFASVAVFALADKGVLDIDAPIVTYVPAYRQDNGKRLTLAHLMSNRSGLSDDGYRTGMGEAIQARQSNPESSIEDLGYGFDIAEGLKRYGSSDLKFEPGSKFDYVNSNWIMVAYILESVAGKPMAEILNEYVFAPAKMESSGAFVVSLEAQDSNIAGAAIGYNADKAMKTDFPLFPFIGGGTYTNAPDMLSFMKALYSGKLISENGLKRFSQIQTPEEDYAFGGRVRTIDGKLYSWQSGSNGATNIVAVHEIGGEYSFVALSNFAHDQGAMFALAEKLAEIRRD